jgi:hypothetical protein
VVGLALHEVLAVHPATKRLVRIGIPDDGFADEEPCLAGWQVPVSEYLHGQTPPMRYWYDFGDDWQRSKDELRGGRHFVPALRRRCAPLPAGRLRRDGGFRNFLAAMADRRSAGSVCQEPRSERGREA